MATATWVRDELEHQQVPYEELHHFEAFTAQAVAQREHVSGRWVAKVVIVMADGNPIELILPANRRVDLDRVRELLQTRDVRLASEVELAQFFPDCEVGAIPPLRHGKRAEVLMDGTLRNQGDIVFQGGTHCDAVRMRFEDWFRIVNPRVETFSQPTENLSRETKAGGAWDLGGSV